jgi:hypothetical protein
MENLTFIITAAIFGYLFYWGSHTKPSKPKDDKKGGKK